MVGNRALQMPGFRQEMPVAFEPNPEECILTLVESHLPVSHLDTDWPLNRMPDLPVSLDD